MLVGTLLFLGSLGAEPLAMEQAAGGLVPADDPPFAGTGAPGTELCLAVLIGGASPCLHGEGSYADRSAIRPSAGEQFPTAADAGPPVHEAVVRT